MLDDRTQAIQAEIEATKTLVDNTRQGFEAEITEITEDCSDGLETTRLEFRMQLAEVEACSTHYFSECSATEARAQGGACQRMGIIARVVHTPKFDG